MSFWSKSPILLWIVIEKPMDFSTIKNKMEAKDGTRYKNVREICADVRFIFKNAMKYNDERDDAHVMTKFEEKWQQLLPKVDEECGTITFAKLTINDKGVSKGFGFF